MSEAWREITGGSNVQPISKRGTRWPPNESVPEVWIAMGYTLRREAGLQRINLKLEADKFVDYWASVTGAKAYKLNWLATWRNWCRSARGVAEEEPAHLRYSDREDLAVRRCKTALALKSARSSMFDLDDVRVALAKGAITQEEARRLGL